MRIQLALISFLLALAIGLPAQAQDIPALTPNRMLCTSIRALERAVEALPNPEAIRSAKTIPAKAAEIDKKTGAPGCIWIGGTFPIPSNNPFGWLYAGDYLMLVNGITLNDGRKFVHATTVVSRRNWRLEDDCSQINFGIKAVLPTGENYRFFGFKTKKGFDPQCRNLVNTVAEAAALNAPPKSYSEVWKSRPYWRTMIACQSIDGLANALDRMVNEQQVNNSDAAIFGLRDGCIRRPVDEIVASRFLGLYRTRPARAADPVFVVEIHEVLYYNKRTRTVIGLLMASNPTRAKFLRLAPACRIETSVPNEGTRRVILLASSLEDVDPVSIDTPTGKRQIDRLENTPVGVPQCETEDKVYN